MPKIKERYEKASDRGWRYAMHEIIFEADTPMGKLFDVALLWAIVLSVLAVMLESVDSIRVEHESLLQTIEWGFTILFTIEYIARIISIRKPSAYIFSFFGIVDLLSLIPTYLSLILAGTHFFLVIRAIRLLRIFRILKLARHVKGAKTIASGLKSSIPKITVFLIFVLTLVIILGTLMYMIEGGENGFDSIPQSIYWAIVTLTTVGYGDIAPGTFLGKVLASVIMLLGYSIIAVPTGIVSAEMVSANRENAPSTRHCQNCGFETHDGDAHYCKKCGTHLHS